MTPARSPPRTASLKNTDSIPLAAPSRQICAAISCSAAVESATKPQQNHRQVKGLLSRTNQVSPQHRIPRPADQHHINGKQTLLKDRQQQQRHCQVGTPLPTADCHAASLKKIRESPFHQKRR